MRQISIESYPNREIRITLVRAQLSNRKTALDSSRDIGSYESDSELTCHSLKTRVPPKKPHKSEAPGNQLPPGFGGLPRFQRFSLYGRRQILRAGGALERECGHEDCLFLTLTLPGSTKAAYKAIACYSGKAVKLLHDWLSNHISNKLSIYTWEWQKRGALHLHYVVHCPDRERGEWIIKNLRTQWLRILDSICEASQIDLYRKHSGFSWASNKEITKVDAQWCKKSVAAYLSKYVSKAGKDSRSMGRDSYCPSRWYGVSRPLLNLTKSLSFKVTLDCLRERQAWMDYEECLSLLQSSAIKCYEYKHTVGDGKTIVAYVNENEQASIWNTITHQMNTHPDSFLNTEQNLRKLAANGVCLIKRHSIWLSTYMQFNEGFKGGKMLISCDTRDITRQDLIYLLDALLYSYRYTQKTRYELPGECKLWFMKVSSCLEKATDSDREWIGALKV